MASAAHVAEDGLVGHQWEEKPWSCEGSMPQGRGMSGQEGGRELGAHRIRGRRNGIADSWRGNWERR